MNYKKIAISLLLISFCLVAMPQPSRAATLSAEIQDKINALILQITSLKAQLAGLIANNPSLLEPPGVPNRAPFINSISPESVTAGSSGFTLTVSGENFSTFSKIWWRGNVGEPTTYVSSKQLTALIPSGYIRAPGIVDIVVADDTPIGGGPRSNVKTLIINPANPVTTAPTITSIFPLSATALGPSFTFTVNGTNFVNGFKIILLKKAGDGDESQGVQPLVDYYYPTTTFVSATQLTATVPASYLSAPQVFRVQVLNQGTAGGHSNEVSFIVYAPLPIITSIGPTSVPINSPSFNLVINGSNFMPGATVRFGGLSSTFSDSYSCPPELVPSTISTSVIQVTIPGACPKTAGNFKVVVKNPGPKTSFPFTVTGNNPIPSITSISPESSLVGGESFNMVVRGGNFINTSFVKFSNQELITTSVSANELNATLPAKMISAVGNFNITVTNPAPGGGISNQKRFMVNTAAGTSLTPPSSIAAPGQPADAIFPRGSILDCCLGIGDSGDDVVLFQKFLIKQGYAIAAGSTGYYGLQTAAAARKFQTDHGLSPVGVAGPKTVEIINERYGGL